MSEPTKKPPVWAKWYWLGWAIFMALSFGIPEYIAVTNDEPGDTLTEVSVHNVWAVIGPETTVLVLGGFFAWLLYHMVRRAAAKQSAAWHNDEPETKD